VHEINVFRKFKVLSAQMMPLGEKEIKKNYPSLIEPFLMDGAAKVFK